MPGGERGGIDERLEGAAHLPASGLDAVEARLAEVAAAHPRQHVAAVQGQRHDRALQVRGAFLSHVCPGRVARPGETADGARLDRLELSVQLLFGRVLQRGVEGGRDLERFVVEAVTEPLLQLPPHLLDEVGREAVAALGRAGLAHHAERGAAPGGGLGRGDALLLLHQGQDQVATRARLTGIPARVVQARALRQSGQQGGLGETRRDAEVVTGRGLDPPGTVAEVDVVQVQLQDLVLAEAALDVLRDPDLQQLAPERPSLAGDAVRECIAGELHREGAGSLLDLAGLEVGHQRAQDPAHVDRPVLVEAPVLGGQERLRHEPRQRLQRDHLAFDRGEVRERRAGAVEQHRRPARLIGRQAPDVRAPEEAAP